MKDHGQPFPSPARRHPCACGHPKGEHWHNSGRPYTACGHLGCGCRLYAEAAAYQTEQETAA